MRQLERIRSAVPETASRAMSGNYGTTRIVGLAFLGIVAWVVVANFPDIRRYIRIKMM